MLRQLVLYAFEHGVPRVWAFVSIGNTPALKMLKRLGFKRKIYEDGVCMLSFDIAAMNPG